MIGIIDYGAGNLCSVRNALGHLELPYRVCGTASDLAAVDRAIVPGVGHFGAAVECMQRSGMFEGLTTLIDADRPVLGICLGMQLLYEGSSEAPDVRGFGLFSGRVERLTGPRVPHMGWNDVELSAPWPFGGGRGPFYFAHSYAVDPGGDGVIGRARVGTTNCAALVGRGSVWGVQFHPEKSGAAGLGLLEAFARW